MLFLVYLIVKKIKKCFVYSNSHQHRITHNQKLCVNKALYVVIDKCTDTTKTILIDNYNNKLDCANLHREVSTTAQTKSTQQISL